MSARYFRARAALAFAASSFVAGFIGFLAVFGWDAMSLSDALRQLLPASISVALVAGLLWTSKPVSARASMMRGVFVCTLSAPILMQSSLAECRDALLAEVIGCSLGVSLFLAKVFGSLALSTALLTGFWLSTDPE